MADSSVRDWIGPPAVSLAAVLGVNLVVQALGLQGGASGPPGWLIGTVWTVIFALYGLAYAALRRVPEPAGSRKAGPGPDGAGPSGSGPDGAGQVGPRKAGIVGLGIICLAYPFYTSGFEDAGVALAGTAATFVAAAALVVWLWPVSRAAALLVAPVLPWLIYAATILV